MSGSRVVNMSEPETQTSHALQVIEFTRVLEIITGRAISKIGAERVLDLRPATDLQWIRDELARVESLRVLLRNETAWRVRTIPDLRAALRRLSIAGTTLSGMELRETGT